MNAPVALFTAREGACHSNRIPVVLLIGLCAATAPWPVGAQAAEPVLDDVAVRLEPCDPFPYVEPGAKGKVSFLLSSKADRELQLSWKVRIGLPSGDGPECEEKLVLAPGDEKRVAMPDAATARRGVVTFDWRLSDQKGRVLELRDRLGVMTLPGPEASHRDGFRFGWGTSLVHFVAQMGEERSMATYARMGCDLIRVGDRWAYSRGPNEAHWDNQHINTGRIVDGAVAAGMDVLYVMWGTPDWARRAEFSNQHRLVEFSKAHKTDLKLLHAVCPPALEAWRGRVTATVGNFKDRVKYWEIWNDEDRFHDDGQHMPNGWVGSTEEYLELLRTSYRDIKAIDPRLTVLNGGFFTLGTTAKHDLNPDMQQRVVREAQESFDIHATINDTAPALLLGPLAELRAELKPAKPLWITRVEQRGAKPDELLRRLLSAKGCGASAFVWMWGLNFDSGNRGLFFPMRSFKTKDRLPLNQHSAFQMEPAGCAYVHAIGLLRMLNPAGRIDTGTPGDWIFCFADPTDAARRQVVGYWTQPKDRKAQHALVVGAGARCAFLDLYGNATPVQPDAAGKVLLPLAHEPAFLVIEGGAPLASASGLRDTLSPVPPKAAQPVATAAR